MTAQHYFRINLGYGISFKGGGKGLITQVKMHTEEHVESTSPDRDIPVRRLCPPRVADYTVVGFSCCF